MIYFARQTPRFSLPHNWFKRIMFEVNITLPATSNGQPLFIRNFETDTSNYHYDVGDLDSKVQFDAVSIKTSNADIRAKVRMTSTSLFLF